jgi:NAD(P)-dependent dehydrogenase (short-subunit alcohol dehydrogenase family)
MSNPVILVVGAGRGLGAAIGRRFGRAGYDVALLARTEQTLEEIGTALRAAGVTTGWTAVDMTDATAFRAAVERFAGHAGRIDVLHFNPSAFTGKGPLELTPDELLADLRLGVASLLTALQAARPNMSAGGRITATGSRAADHPWAAAASLGVQKAALRNLVTAIDLTLAPDGIRAASLTVNGTITAGSRFDPDLIADALYRVATTSDDAWQPSVTFDG